MITLFSFILRGDHEATRSCVNFMTNTFGVSCCLVFMAFGSNVERALSVVVCAGIFLNWQPKFRVLDIDDD
jgi:hypothetical protein